MFRDNRGEKWGSIKLPSAHIYIYIYIFAISRFPLLEFWCSDGHLAQFDVILTSVLTNSDLFRPVLSGGPDLFSPISTYFVSQWGAMGGTPNTKLYSKIDPWQELHLKTPDLFPQSSCPSKRKQSLNVSTTFGLSGPVRDTPPYRAIPFRDSISEEGIAPICLVFIGYRASIAEIPLLRGGGSHLHFACSSREKRSENEEGVSHPIGHVETPKTP